jgi:metal-responsive CopG/Arc/MetJ family transcriptional regulator
MAGLTTISVKVPPDDLAVLRAVVEHEQLRRSDIIRRAVRAYAKQLGVKVGLKRAKPRR